MKPRLSVFYSTLYGILLSVSGIGSLACLVLALIFRDLGALWILLFMMLSLTFAGILWDCKTNGISAFHRVQFCKGGVCEFTSDGKRTVKAIAWNKIKFVTVVDDYMTKQRWICFSKNRLSSSQSHNPLRHNVKCDFYVLYPYSERAYEVAMEEVQKHRDTKNNDQ